MVSNPNSGLPSDLLTSVDLPWDKPITKVTDDQARSLIRETGPDSRIVDGGIERKIFENLDSPSGVDTLPTRWPHRLVA